LKITALLQVSLAGREFDGEDDVWEDDVWEGWPANPIYG